jgi:hypothetical protein
MLERKKARRSPQKLVVSLSLASAIAKTKQVSQEKKNHSLNIHDRTENE